jgi:signal transduction histidine kinase
LLLSLLLGVIGGLLIARYVGRRIEAIVRVVDEVGEGDLSRRAPTVGDTDAFDRLSARINRMLERIAALMDELRLTTDSLAHDLRSPIGRLRARIERALATDDEAQRDVLLSGVLAEADALSRMLATLMEIGRSESMAGRKSFAPIDPAILVAELAEMYEPLAEEAGVRLVARIPAELPVLIGHRQLLAQALSNLVDNALLHGAGGGRVTITAGIGDGGTMRLSVADAGAGIAAADRAEALRRFGRLDTSRSRPGAGLGLSLVSSVAHLHGGTLQLEDAGPGLLAILILPLDSHRTAP